MGISKIQWTERTWNPTRGCSRVSPGCLHCYAERLAARFCGPIKDYEGVFRPRAPFEDFVQIANGHPQWTGKVELLPDKLDEPLHVRKPSVWFVDSMSDLFHEGLSDDAIMRVFHTMQKCPHHTFQVLTKRAKNMKRVVSEMAGKVAARWAWPLPNVWLGVSVEDRERKTRIDLLRETPAAVRFVSFEPLLEYLGRIDCRGIDLAIWGGESGPDARPCNVAWIRTGMKQARMVGCANFVKQLGANVIDRNDAGFDGETPRAWPMDTEWRAELDTGYQGAHLRMLLNDRKGGDMSEWPLDLRVRQKPLQREYPLSLSLG